MNAYRKLPVNTCCLILLACRLPTCMSHSFVKQETVPVLRQKSVYTTGTNDKGNRHRTLVFLYWVPSYLHFPYPGVCVGRTV